MSETAFPHRYDHYDLLVHPATDNTADFEQMIHWARECWKALQPFVEQAIYVNALQDALEEGECRVCEAYGPNYDRFVVLKNKYDLTNLFRLTANIKPEFVGAQRSAASPTAAPDGRRAATEFMRNHTERPRVSRSVFGIRRNYRSRRQMDEEDKTDSEFNLLAMRCSEFLDGGNIEGAIASVSILQANLQSAPAALSTLQKAQVACLLVDVGASSRDEIMVRGGLDLFDRNYAAFSKAIHPSSLEYNLGNASVNPPRIGGQLTAIRSRYV